MRIDSVWSIETQLTLNSTGEATMFAQVGPELFISGNLTPVVSLVVANG